jgi:hypothetical protein
MNAEEILEDLLNPEIKEKPQVIATCGLSNHGGVAIFYCDSECVVAQYYEETPQIYEVEYTIDVETMNENTDFNPIFKIGEIEIPLGHCMRT